MAMKRILTGDDLSAMSTTCSGLNTRLAALESAPSLSSLNSRMTSAEGSITTNSGNITSLSSRMTAAETGLTGQGTRLTSLETWRGNKAASLGAAIAADLTTNYNTVTTLLGILVSALNTTNIKVNAITTRQAAHETMFQARELVV